jgi:hypothetical protein
MITADEYRFELLTAYDELATALEAIGFGYGLSDEDFSPEDAL